MTLNLQKYQIYTWIYMHINIILYKITCHISMHISILAILYSIYHAIYPRMFFAKLFFKDTVLQTRTGSKVPAAGVMNILRPP